MKKSVKLWLDAHGPDAIATLILGLALTVGFYGATLGAIELIFHSSDPRVQALGGVIVVAEILAGFKMTAT